MSISNISTAKPVKRVSLQPADAATGFRGPPKKKYATLVAVDGRGAVEDNISNACINQPSPATALAMLSQGQRAGGELSKASVPESKVRKSNQSHLFRLDVAPVDQTERSKDARYQWNWLDLVLSVTDPCLRSGDNKCSTSAKNSIETIDLVSDDDERLKAIAKSLESKYGTGVDANSGSVDAAKKIRMKRRRQKHDDHADAGFGYDSEDSFIDNEGAFDETVPRHLEPELGGFYVNMGPLHMRERDLSQTESEMDDLSVGEPVKDDPVVKKIKKKKLKLKAVEDDNPQSAPPNLPSSPSAPNATQALQASNGGPVVEAKPARLIKVKKERKKIRIKNMDKNMCETDNVIVIDDEDDKHGVIITKRPKKTEPKSESRPSPPTSDNLSTSVSSAASEALVQLLKKSMSSSGITITQLQTAASGEQGSQAVKPSTKPKPAVPTQSVSAPASQAGASPTRFPATTLAQVKKPNPTSVAPSAASQSVQSSAQLCLAKQILAQMSNQQSVGNRSMANVAAGGSVAKLQVKSSPCATISKNQPVRSSTLSGVTRDKQPTTLSLAGSTSVKTQVSSTKASSAPSTMKTVHGAKSSGSALNVNKLSGSGTQSLKPCGLPVVLNKAIQGRPNIFTPDLGQPSPVPVAPAVVSAINAKQQYHVNASTKLTSNVNARSSRGQHDLQTDRDQSQPTTAQFYGKGSSATNRASQAATARAYQDPKVSESAAEEFKRGLAAILASTASHNQNYTAMSTHSVTPTLPASSDARCGASSQNAIQSSLPAMSTTIHSIGQRSTPTSTFNTDVTSSSLQSTVAGGGQVLHQRQPATSQTGAVLYPRSASTDGSGAKIVNSNPGIGIEELLAHYHRQQMRSQSHSSS